VRQATPAPITLRDKERMSQSQIKGSYGDRSARADPVLDSHTIQLLGASAAYLPLTICHYCRDYGGESLVILKKQVIDD
jgi:hypothetical protein